METKVIVAGAVFFLARLLVIWPLLGNPFDAVAGGFDEITWMPWVGASFAGLSGAPLWWLLVGRQSFLKRGAIVGLLAALFSYVGITWIGALLNNEFAAIATAITGWFVFPVLSVVGVLLGWLQQKWTQNATQVTILDDE